MFKRITPVYLTQSWIEYLNFEEGKMGIMKLYTDYEEIELFLIYKNILTFFIYYCFGKTLQCKIIISILNDHSKLTINTFVILFRQFMIVFQV